MVEQHEEERRRLSLHLHDETAQVFTAVRLRMGLLRERADAVTGTELDRVLALLDDGIASIRGITRDLRPALIDDLGLLPAMRALADECADRFGLVLDARFDPALPPLTDDAGLALYRALQEALSNVAEHARATRVTVELRAVKGAVRLSIGDDGGGFAPGLAVEDLQRAGHFGLAGMRERVIAQGGSVVIGVSLEGGALLVATLPASVA